MFLFDSLYQLLCTLIATTSSYSATWMSLGRHGKKQLS